MTRTKYRINEIDMKKKETALDKQEGGNHYKDMAIQPAEYCFRNNMLALPSAVVKYVSRYKNKNGKEDLFKAIHCLELLIEFEYGGNDG